MQGSLTSDDRLVPSLRRRAIKNQLPALNNTDFIAPNSTIVGRVELGEHSSIWYGSVLRGDLNEIKIGKNTVVQDLVTFYPHKDKIIKLGDNVLIAPNTVLESCTLENNSFVGMGACLRSGSKVESYGFVAAGAVIPENTTVPSYQVWAGNPAKYLRDLTNEEKEILDEHHQELQELAKVHSEETEKTMREVLNYYDQEAEEEMYEPEEYALQKMKELGFPMEFDDEDFIEQRIHHKDTGSIHEEQHWKKTYDVYEQDLYNFPDSFKVYGENHNRYEEIKKFFDENPHAEGRPVERKERQEAYTNEPFERKF